MKMYFACDIWRRVADGTVARYRCFQVLPKGGYCVQSKDVYDARATPGLAAQHERQFIELFGEEAPDSRTRVYETLDEAIREHDREFAGENADDGDL